MKAARIHRFGEPHDVLVVEDVPVPRPGPGEVVIRIAAASLNPIDCWRRGGYGRRLFRSFGEASLPVILGRDCSGTVEAAGPGVRRFVPGQEVWSAPDPFQDGTHAEFIRAAEDDVEPKPPSLTHQEAASLPFVGLTVWAALVGKAGLGPETAQGRKVLVHAGSGGIGSFAIQLLKAWGAHVAATCSADNAALVESLGADEVIDYRTRDFSHVLSGFDVVLDPLGGETQRKSVRVLKRGPGACLVTLVTPALPLVDRFGLAAGGAAAVAALAAQKTGLRLFGGRRLHWAFFAPDGAALAEIGRLVEDGKIRPVIDRIYDLDQIAEAHAYSETRRARGKIVVRITDT